MALLQGLCSAALKIGLAMFLAMSLSRPVAAASDVISFREDIHPIIQIRCLICHKPGGDGYEKSGLDLRTYNSLMKGTKFGPIVTPGDAFMSNFNVLIEGRASRTIRMPHGKRKLTSCDIGLFRKWVNQGAQNN